MSQVNGENMKIRLTQKSSYAAAVAKLVQLAMSDCSGSRAAAQVVLSAYNGNDWQLDITDLCVLDRPHYEAAIAVIRGRTEIRTEPHLLIENGGALFRQLWEQWSRYHIGNRWKPQCPECSGHGKVFVDEISDAQETCPRCQGEGLLDSRGGNDG